jgi:hypothetical protein
VGAFVSSTRHGTHTKTTTTTRFRRFLIERLRDEEQEQIASSLGTSYKRVLIYIGPTKQVWLRKGLWRQKRAISGYRTHDLNMWLIAPVRSVIGFAATCRESCFWSSCFLLDQNHPLLLASGSCDPCPLAVCAVSAAAVFEAVQRACVVCFRCVFSSSFICPHRVWRPHVLGVSMYKHGIKLTRC